MEADFECWLASNPELHTYMLNDHCSSSDHSQPSPILKDVVDGEVCRTHPKFSESCYYLKVILYYDEVELTNALSPQCQKIGFFYWMLGNLPPEQRFKFENIRLLCLVKYADIDTYGIDAVLDSRCHRPSPGVPAPGRTCGNFGVGSGFVPEMQRLSHSQGGVSEPQIALPHAPTAFATVT
jgi:hypothetical protein